MPGGYWSQWDREDMDSCDVVDFEEWEVDEGCVVRVECDCGSCMKCMGMSWRDFE
jgi:hypothetical protein